MKHKEHDKAFRKSMLKKNNATKLKEDIEYLITPFVYFESGGANDIIIKIDRIS